MNYILIINILKIKKYPVLLISRKKVNTFENCSTVHTSEQIHTSPTLTSNLITLRSSTHNDNNITNTYPHLSQYKSTFTTQIKIYISINISKLRMWILGRSVNYRHRATHQSLRVCIKKIIYCDHPIKHIHTHQLQTNKIVN